MIDIQTQLRDLANTRETITLNRYGAEKACRLLKDYSEEMLAAADVIDRQAAEIKWLWRELNETDEQQEEEWRAIEALKIEIKELRGKLAKAGWKDWVDSKGGRLG